MLDGERGGEGKLTAQLWVGGGDREQSMWVFSCFRLLHVSPSKDCTVASMAEICDCEQWLRGQDGYCEGCKWFF